MSRILNDKDRNKLLEAYKEDKLKDAPTNITDKTLIENYGTDEQKALLEAPAKKAATGVENTQTTTNATASAATANRAAATVGNESQENRKEYVDALNNYIVLHDGQAPKGQLSLEQLIEANNAKTAELSKASNAPKPKPKAQPQNSPNLQTSTFNKNVEKVTLVNKAGNERKVSKFTYENYLKNDAVWKLKPSEPTEIKNI